MKPLAGICSVVLTVYNRDEYLSDCLWSISNTADMPIELIVVDGGSCSAIKDKIVSIVKNFEDSFSQVKMIACKERISAAEAINIGIGIARGEHLFITNDDIFFETGNWCSKMVNCSIEYPNAAIIGVMGHYTYNEQTVRLDYDTKQHIGCVRNTKQIAGILCKIDKQAFDSIGLYDENISYQGGGDGDYSIRVLASGYELVVMEDILVHHRAHGSKEDWDKARESILDKYGDCEVNPDNMDTYIGIAKRIYEYK